MFFTAVDKTSCPVNKCEVKVFKDGACSNDDTVKVTMGSSSPWAIEMVQNNKAGWTETVCIKCSANSAGTYTDYNGKGGAGWKVTQSPQPCSAQYSALSPVA